MRVSQGGAKPVALYLITGDRHFSSWSMRGHVIMEEKGMDYTEIPIELDWPMDYEGKGVDLEAEAACIAAAAVLRDADPTGLWEHSVTAAFPRVPLLVDDVEGVVVADSVAIADHLDRQYPDTPRLLGRTARERTEILNLTLHVHADLGHLMHDASYGLSLRTHLDAKPTPEAEQNAHWVADTVDHCLARTGGPFLFGAFSLADAMVAPIAQQVAGWRIDIGAGRPAVDYLARLRARPSVARHLAEANEPYERIAGAPVGGPQWIAAHYRHNERHHVISNWQSDMYHQLANDTARRAFELARGGNDLDGIVDELARGRESARDRIRADVTAFFGLLHPDNVHDTTLEFEDAPF
jgi:glutathione S-transferase